MFEEVCCSGGAQDMLRPTITTNKPKCSKQIPQRKMLRADSRTALPLCPQAKKPEAAGKAPPIRRDVDGASFPRVAYVLLLRVNFCHSNSMHAVSRTCRLHHKSPGFFCFESLRSTRAPGRQPCAETRREESQVPEAAPRCKGATRPPGAKDPAMLKGHAPFFDGSWHGLSNKCV